MNPVHTDTLCEVLYECAEISHQRFLSESHPLYLALHIIGGHAHADSRQFLIDGKCACPDFVKLAVDFP